MAQLTGTDESSAAASLRRLAASGLIVMDDDGISVSDGKDATGPNVDSQMQHATRTVSHPARRVPVPRRVLRLLANSTRPVFIATVLGHLLRCLFSRGGRIASAGLCKSSWIADVFGVDERNVKAARRELIECGWLLVDDASQRFLNRWGLPVRVNLDWQSVASDRPSGIDKRRRDRVSPPPVTSEEAKSPPPLKNSYRFQRSKNHVPIPAGGACGPVVSESVRPFRDVRPADLRSTAELRSLFRGAVRVGLMRACAADELRFFAAAERAASLGTSNPAGFFASVVRRGLWHVISQRDEDAARQRLMHCETSSRLQVQCSLRRVDSVLSGLLHAIAPVQAKGAG